MSLNVQFAVVPGPDGKQWVAWQTNDGAITVTYPPMAPDDVEAFARDLATGFNQAAAEAKRSNSGLLVPGVNIDPKLVDQMRRANGTNG